MNYAIEMLNITKTFGPLVANDNISFQVQPGEIHAILGENGAGKSTLMSILFGLYTADRGTIKINGEEVKIANPNDANRYKIGMVHQHFKLVEVFTVLDNIVLGNETIERGLINNEVPRKKIQELCDKYALHVDLNALIKDISVGMQQRVEIMKMLYRDANILIFDEPTAVLTPQEIEGLFKVIKEFTKEGKSIIIITHKLNEIKAIADRCTVLRKGKHIATVNVKETSVEKLAELMVGRDVIFEVEKKMAEPKEIVFSVKNLNLYNKDRTKKLLDQVHFDVRAGEIVVIAGIEGNGQTQLVKLITGLEINQEHGSQFILNEKDITHASIRERFEAGMAHIPEDRQKYGLILDYTLAENMISNEFYMAKFQKHGLLKFDVISNYTNELIERYDIRSSLGEKTKARAMSGGNQQKAIIARETSRAHNLLIASQPTRGLDVGAIEYVHKTIVAERDRNNAILVISLELDEVMSISDRILVMYEGRIVADLDPKNTTIEEIGLYMSGSKHMEVTNNEI
ncbi:MAG: heme ABC transporter ATP-binding protein [Tenericutes bacterium GWC2_39_45]|nr:MAG: heme ABC transporter ATP-binding protein [Tenericutes bacterium GWA2_38_26]OHE30428.1 MAG: heme ABC transporter ATP-binding protein [Tenericutes bacterium GWC2_39_45]OHE31546.1 MAG: heme ABC transporter ATP-binding protein [Tenericutes bacterium GWD2_38_27]OHE43189.1 MAG: heme ABC transporter ATP-binding protein [Tenericutes bacterium GWF2_38_8]HBG32996.1 heme ABC transporter ATP-binding protein [Acholeplasmataceae bacterium]